MPKIESFDDNALQAICKIIGDTADGLTGSEIDKLLSLASIPNVSPGTTKNKRLFDALHAKQLKDDCGNNIVAFIQRVMDPVRYIGNKEIFKSRKEQLNTVLSLRGYIIRDDGTLGLVERVTTLTEAERRARSLHLKLQERGVHSRILTFCRAELLDENYFHAVFEATKSIADTVRNLTGLTADGSELVDEVFSVKHPLLIINKLSTETEQSEQKGYANFLKGIFGMFRNTTAHAPKIHWNISEQDALDLLVMASFAHRKLDAAVRTGLMPKV